MKCEVKSLWKETESYIDELIELSGFVKTLRSQKNFGFIEVNDGTFFKNVQVVFDDTLENFKEICKFTIGSSFKVVGKVIKSKGNKQPFEIKAESITLIGSSDPDFPLQKKRHTKEYLRTIAHLRPRTNLYAAIFRVRSVLSFAIHKFFNEKGFVYVHTPIITGSDCEGAGEMFRVTTLPDSNPPMTEDGKVNYKKDFFSKQTSLTVSGQLAVENYCMAFNKVYTFGPTFRAENSNTPRHASEFWMIEPEIAFADINDDMDLAEEMLKYIVQYVLDEAPEEMEFFNQWVQKGLIDRLKALVASDFERVTYTKAIEILQNCGKNFDYSIEWGSDLQTEHERYLTEEHFKKPVFVIDWPKDIKAFYMKLNDDGKTVAGMDCLVPGVGEIIGGSQREERYEILLNKMNEMGLEKEDYQWYLDLRRFGTNEHAGFGLGFERALMYLTGVENIRDVIPFPRTPRNADF